MDGLGGEPHGAHVPWWWCAGLVCACPCAYLHATHKRVCACARACRHLHRTPWHARASHLHPPTTTTTTAATLQIEGEFPELLGIKESLIKYVFEPASKHVSGGALGKEAVLEPKGQVFCPKEGVDGLLGGILRQRRRAVAFCVWQVAAVHYTFFVHAQ